MHVRATIFLLIGFQIAATAQNLKPGFDKEEYRKLMTVSAQFGDSAYSAAIPTPAGYQRVYRSPSMGLENKWDLWRSSDGTNIISIRGTTASGVSWLANFYAAMVPAKGKLQLGENEFFNYQLAENPQAAVHVGWLLATAYLSRDMLPKIDSAYKKGQREFLIIGHSQGGAIAFLLTAYLHQLQKQNLLPRDIRFKTYCSAGPKPGNLAFAYEYEAATQGGWAYNVVNAIDWVPESPVSLQGLDNFNEINPFADASSFIKKQKWPQRWALSYAFRKLTKPTKKAIKQYRKYLGTYVAKSVKKALPDYVPPTYLHSSDYVRTGNTIVLTPDENYYKLYPQDKKKIFVNHLHGPYLYLLNQLSFDPMVQVAENTLPDGSWTLESISGLNNLNEIFTARKPQLIFNKQARTISGNTGCNSFNGALATEGNDFHFPENVIMTKMACAGNGENLFLETIRKTNRFKLNGNYLELYANDQLLMRFVK